MDSILEKIHKTVFNVENIINSVDKDGFKTLNIEFNGMVTVTSNLLINNNSFFNKNLLINGKLFIPNKIINGNNLFLNNCSLNNCIVKNSLTCLSDIISDNIYNNLNINISNSAIINNNISVMSNLYIGGVCTLKNLYVNTLSSNTNLEINSDIINIGNTNSIISINGTSINLLTSDIEIQNKIISLNYNKDISLLDNGTLSGFEIYTIDNNNGFIRTNTNNTLFEIKLPGNNPSNYIVELDLNNNINITGRTIFSNNTTIVSSLYVSGSINLNNMNINNSLHVSGNAIINNMYISNISVLKNTIINNNSYINLNLNISNTCCLNNNVTILSIINCNDILLNNITINSNFTASSLLIKDNVTIYSNLNTSFININGNVNVSTCNILNTAIIKKNLNCDSDLNVKNDGIFVNVTVLSDLNIKENLLVNGNITINSNLYTNYNLIMPLKEYISSNEAAYNGIPFGGLFRTGDIVRIRGDVISPNILLIGEPSIKITTLGINYIEQGINIIDDVDKNLPIYIISIKRNNIELLSKLLQITNNVYVPEVDTSASGITIITYAVVDNFNNISSLTRKLVILSVELYLYNNTNIKFGTDGMTINNAFKYVNSNLNQKGRISIWGFNGSVIKDPNFTYNGVWSLLFKLKLSEGITVYDLHFDDQSNTWGDTKPELPQDGAKGSMIEFRFGQLVSSKMTTIYISPNLNSYFNAGVYFTIYRDINKYNICKIYNLNYDLIGHFKTIKPFTYTNNLSLFSWQHDRYDNIIFYSGIIFSTQVILSPTDWR